MRCSGTGPKVPYSWREVAGLSDRRAAGLQLGGSSRFARRHRQPRPLLVPKTLSGLLARDDASPDPSDPHLGTSVPHPVSPAVRHNADGSRESLVVGEIQLIHPTGSAWEQWEGIGHHHHPAPAQHPADLLRAHHRVGLRRRAGPPAHLLERLSRARRATAQVFKLGYVMTTAPGPRHRNRRERTLSGGASTRVWVLVGPATA